MAVAETLTMRLFLIVTPGQAPPATTATGAISRDADFRRAGTNLAANTLAMLQIEGIRDAGVQAPYPRLRGSWPR
jgi:hypothetical protein